MANITYKIDRILSSSTTGLQLGLKTNVALKIANNGNTPYLNITSLAGYETSPLGVSPFGVNGAIGPSAWGDFIESPSSPYATNKNLIPTAGWVEGLTAIRIGYVMKYLSTTYLAAGNHISFRQNDGHSDSTPKLIIDSDPLYSGSGELTTVNNVEIHTVAPPDDNGIPVTNGDQTLGSATSFITGFETDKYGKITKVYGRRVSTADMADVSNFDNYRQWGLHVGDTTLGIKSHYTVSDQDNGKNSTTENANYALNVISGNAIVPVLSSNNLSFNLQIDANQFTTDTDANHATAVLRLLPINNVEQTTAGLYKITVSDVGIVTSTSAVQASDIMSLVSTFNGSVAGIVPVKVTGVSGNTANAANTMYFLNSDAQWVNVPYDKVQVDTATAGTNYSLLGAAYSSSGVYSAAVKTTIYFDSDGVLHGKFNGDGSAITNIIAGSIVAGAGNTKINSDLLNLSTLKPLLGLDGLTGNSGIVLATNGALSTINTALTSQVPVSGVAVLSAALTNDGSAISDTPQMAWRDLKTLVTSVVAGEGGMRFMGVIGSGTGEVAWTTVQSSFKKGDFYKISTIPSGTQWDYAGYGAANVEPGDTMIALKDYASAYDNASPETKQTYWAVIQGNLANAVTGVNASTAISAGTYNVPVASTADMNKIYSSYTATKDSNSNWLIHATAEHASDAAVLATSRNLWGQPFDGSASVSGNMLDVGTITPLVPQAGDNATAPTIGTAAAPWSAAYITDLHGNTFDGTSDYANQLTRPLILTFGNQTFTYDGSAVADADRTFSFNAGSLGLISDIDAHSSITITGQGNVISDITLSRKSNTPGDADYAVLTYSIAKDITAVTSISSTLFDSTIVSGSIATISPYANKGSGLHFFSQNTLPDANASDVLRLQGILLASNLRVVADNAAHDVAHKRSDELSSIDQSKKILVADATTGDYSFIKSSVNIAGSGLTWPQGAGSDTVIPTQAAVKEYVDQTATAISAASKVECLSIPFSYANTSPSVASGYAIPATAIVDHIDVAIDVGFPTGATFNLVQSTDTTKKVIQNSEIDLSSTGDVFSYKFGREAGYLIGNTQGGTTAFVPHIIITVTGSTGSGTCYIYYTKAPTLQLATQQAS